MPRVTRLQPAVREVLPLVLRPSTSEPIRARCGGGRGNHRLDLGSIVPAKRPRIERADWPLWPGAVFAVNAASRGVRQDERTHGSVAIVPTSREAEEGLPGEPPVRRDILADFALGYNPPPMRLLVALLVWFLRASAKASPDLVLENLALRQQLATYARAEKRPPLQPSERAFWVALSKAWARWRSPLVIVQPATVIAWHRRAFRAYWRWRPANRGHPHPLRRTERVPSR